MLYVVANYINTPWACYIYGKQGERENGAQDVLPGS